MTRAPTFYDLNRDDLSELSAEIAQACAMLSHTFEEASFVGLMRLSEHELKDYLWAAHSRVSEARRRIGRVLGRNRFNTAAEAATFEDWPDSFTALRIESMRTRRGFNFLDQIMDLAGTAAGHAECSEHARDTFEVIRDFVGKAKSNLARMDTSTRQSEVAGVVGQRLQYCDEAIERALKTLTWLRSEKCDGDIAEALVRRAHDIVAASDALLNSIEREEVESDGGKQCRELVT